MQIASNLRRHTWILVMVSVVLDASALAEPQKTDGPAQPVSNIPVIALDEAQKLALENNPNFRNINEMIYQADMAIYSAWSMLMPTVTASANIIRNQHEVKMAIPDFEAMAMADPTDPTDPRHTATDEFVIQDLWAKDFGFSLNTTLLNPRSFPLIKLANDDHERTLLKAQIQRNDLLFAVTAAYYQAYSMDEMIAVAKENLAMANEFLRHAELLNKAGQGTQIDITRAQIQVVDAEKELSSAEDAKRRAMIALKYLMGAKTEFTIQGPGTVSAVKGSIGRMQQQALSKRVELKEAAVQERIAERARKETLTKWLPVIDATYSWSWASAGGFTGSNVNWMLIFGAKWNVFLGGDRIAEYKSRQSQKRVARNMLEQVTLEIKQEVENNHLDVEKQKRNIALAEKQVSLAEQNHHLVSRQFKAGIVSSLDVVNASSELAAKRILRVYERLQFDLAILTLQKSLGEYNSLALNHNQ